jgi:anti-anti-sigma factor
LVSIRQNLSRAESTHVVLDFSRVEILTSPSIGSLLLLQRHLSERGYRLILCNVHLATKCILRVAGLDAFFDFAVDKFAAMDRLQPQEGQLQEACE